ncbi:MAG: GDSL-type esterase/lipase family protein [Kiritimatiellae bacterium]|nr:GDSL-type esterase/lipase family protein [Kiritimatiellia bacterium]
MNFSIRNLSFGGLLCAALMLAGCEGSSTSHLGDGHDFGPNNPNLYVAIGDSITAGDSQVGSSNYPSILAGMLNKTVINEGNGGDSSGEVMDRLYPILDDYKPGFVLILAGINDLIMGYGEENAARNIRIMVHACQDNKTIPVIATLTPVFESYSYLDSSIMLLNVMIQQIALDLNVAVVDLNKAFNDDPIYILPGGIHPNATGNALMALTFDDVVK